MAIMRGFGRRVRRWVSRGLSTLLQKLYDGPQPTDRLRGFVVEFMYFYPHATRADWMLFAYKLGSEMHNTGMKRGYELGLAERMQLPPPPDGEYTWTWSTGKPTTADGMMAGVVPEEDEQMPQGMNPEEQARYYQWRLHDEMTRIGRPGRE